jgi:hypothetical protein
MNATIVFIATLVIGAIIMAILEAKDESPDPVVPMKRINPAIIKYGTDAHGNVMEAYQLDDGSWRDLYNEIDLPKEAGRRFAEVGK